MVINFQSPPPRPPENRRQKITEELVVDYSNFPFYCYVCEKEHINGACEFEGKCEFCKKRDAVLHFGDMLSFTHGGGLNCCNICAVEKQLQHARERAAVISDLERQLKELKDAEETA